MEFPTQWSISLARASLAKPMICKACAQALCLEEMFERQVLSGAIFHHASKRRREVHFDHALRSLVIETALAVRQLLTTNNIPTPVADERCPNCSLVEACMPYTLKDFNRSARSNNPFLVVEDE